MTSACSANATFLIFPSIGIQLPSSRPRDPAVSLKSWDDYVEVTTRQIGRIGDLALQPRTGYRKCPARLLHLDAEHRAAILRGHRAQFDRADDLHDVNHAGVKRPDLRR